MAFAAIGASCSPRTSVRIARMPALRMDSSSPRGDHEVAQSGTAAFICCKFVLTFQAEIFNVPILFYCFVSCGSMYVTQHMSVQSAETLISSAQLRTVIGVLSSHSAKSVQPTEYPNLLHQISTRLSLSTTLCYRSQH